MESEEKEYREALERKQSEAVREAHEAMKQLQEQLESQAKSSEITIQAYMKEHDSLKALLAGCKLYSRSLASRRRSTRNFSGL